MDLEFFCRLYKHGKFLKLNEYLGYFRCYPQNKSSTMLHIGKEEAAREWKRLFASENRSYQFKPKKNLLYLLKLSTELIKEPILVGFPYIVHRFSNKR
jgi:hypothetical protein